MTTSATEIVPKPSPPAPDRRRRLTLAAAAGSVLAALAASACCLGPLVLAVLGIGGGALLVALEPYRPYFLTATIALLGAGFYFQYRRPKAAATAGDACGCELPRARRAGNAMLWVATAAVVALAAFPYVAQALWG